MVDVASGFANVYEGARSLGLGIGVAAITKALGADLDQSIMIGATTGTISSAVSAIYSTLMTPTEETVDLKYFLKTSGLNFLLHSGLYSVGYSAVLTNLYGFLDGDKMSQITPAVMQLTGNIDQAINAANQIAIYAQHMF